MSCKMPFYLPLEFFLGKRLSFVHPGCTFESLSLPPCHLGKLPCLRPTDLPQLLFGNSGQIFMNSHEVISLPSRIWEAPINPQVRQANQDQLLLVCGSDSGQSTAGC